MTEDARKALATLQDRMQAARVFHDQHVDLRGVRTVAHLLAAIEAYVASLSLPPTGDVDAVERVARAISHLDGVDAWITGTTMEVELWRDEKREEARAALAAMKDASAQDAEWNEKTND